MLQNGHNHRHKNTMQKIIKTQAGNMYHYKNKDMLTPPPRQSHKPKASGISGDKKTYCNMPWQMSQTENSLPQIQKPSNFTKLHKCCATDNKSCYTQFCTWTFQPTTDIIMKKKICSYHIQRRSTQRANYMKNMDNNDNNTKVCLWLME